MKYLGIDYGTKKIGLATSDELGMMAFPHSVVRNDNKFFSLIDKMIHEDGVEAIVFGYSLDGQGNENKVMGEIKDVMGRLSFLHAVPMYLENEGYTSTEARRSIDYATGPRGNVASARKKATKGMIFDDKAAALILQRFLERQK